MPDPFAGWLSYVALLLALTVPIFASLAALLRYLDNMLGSVLSMCARVRRFRHEATAPVMPHKRVAGHRAKVVNTQGPSAPM